MSDPSTRKLMEMLDAWHKQHLESVRDITQAIGKLDSVAKKYETSCLKVYLPYIGTLLVLVAAFVGLSYMPCGKIDIGSVVLEKTCACVIENK